MSKPTMDAEDSSQVAAGAAGREYAPVDGSWVAELEAAKDELEDLLHQSSSRGGKSGGGGALFNSYLRMCRAYKKLRQWDKLDGAANKGLLHCSTYTSPRSADKVSPWKARFQAYRDHARRELAVPTASLYDPNLKEMFRNTIKKGLDPDHPWRSHNPYTNSNVLQSAALEGDVRLLETIVALGAAVDMPFLDRPGIPVVAPADASALVMACASVATAEADHPVLEMSRRACEGIPGARERIDGTVECAMQLVRLGADPLRRLNVANVPDTSASMVLRHVGFDGKTALELAKLARRPQLVELMERNVRYNPEERANVVHCRCGSRLPWKE